MPAPVVVQFIVDHAERTTRAGLVTQLPAAVDQALAAGGFKGKLGAPALAKHPGEEVPPDAYVFPSENSASGHITSARAALKAVAGPKITEYDIRRTFEDVATQCRVDPDVRRLMLNHAHFDVHLKHYGYNPEATIEPMNQIAAWLDTPAPSSRLHPPRPRPPSPSKERAPGAAWTHESWTSLFGRCLPRRSPRCST